MVKKQAKIMLVETGDRYRVYVFTEEKVLLKAENFKEKNLKKATKIQCFPPLGGLYVKDKNLYKPLSANCYERYILSDSNVRQIFRAEFNEVFKTVSCCNKILFLYNKKSSAQSVKYFQQLPSLQVSADEDYFYLRRGVDFELDKFSYSKVEFWKKILQQNYGSLVAGLDAPYLRHIPLQTLINLQCVLYLAQIKPLKKQPNPLAQLLPFLKSENYRFESEYASLLCYVKLFEGYIAAGKEKDFFAVIKEQAGDKYGEHLYQDQSGSFGVLNSPIGALGRVYTMLGFILYNTPRQEYKLRISFIYKIYLEGAGWTTGLELEKLRLSNFAGVKVKSNSLNFRLHLEQQAVIFGCSFPFLNKFLHQAVNTKLYPKITFKEF